MNCPNCNAEVAREDEHVDGKEGSTRYYTCQPFDFHAAYQSERTKRVEAEAIAGRMREVLHEIVGDHELIELLREPDTGAHSSTLGRAKTALESTPTTVGAELRAMEDVCEAATPTVKESFATYFANTAWIASTYPTLYSRLKRIEAALARLAAVRGGK
jgi:hypothetical protein